MQLSVMSHKELLSKTIHSKVKSFNLIKHHDVNKVNNMEIVDIYLN